MKLWVVTASWLSDGGAAYLEAGRRWTRSLSEALTEETREAAEIALDWARGQERAVCDPYLVGVRSEAGRLRPSSLRERIRAEGPAPTLARLGYGRSGAPRRRLG